MVQLISTVLATTSLLFSITAAQISTNSTTSAAGFVSSDKYFSFALNVPQDEDSNELYFTLQGTDTTWVAVGLGNDQMANTLIFMAYADSSGKNVTLSPRLSYGNVEPSYTSNITLSILPGSGVINGTIKVNAKCGNCRSWKGGSLDPASKEGKFIFASGPGGTLKSNSKSANVKRHSSYGSFVMDLTTAVGEPDIPDDISWNTVGSVETQNKFDKRDFSGAAHATLMVLTFVGLLPLGVLILRVLKSPKWHGVTQGISMAIALCGMAIGIWMGMKYNRTKNFNSPHQIIGIIVIVAMIAQFILGFLHHRIYKQTETPIPTKLAPVHVWLGRFVILVGIINGFIGFPLALNPKYDLALLAVILFMAIIFGPIVFWRYRRNIKKAKGETMADEGYQSQPWVTQGQGRSDISLGQMRGPPPYQGMEGQQGRTFV